jgi:hypothetical protein
MLVTELPMVTLVRPLQPPNAPPPMMVTELGMVTLVRPQQARNAPSPMLVKKMELFCVIQNIIITFAAAPKQVKIWIKKQ